MQIEFMLHENDYVTYQLYEASKSERLKKERRQGKIITPLTFFIIGLLFLKTEGILFACIFTAIGIMWMLYYSYNYKQKLYLHYKQYVHEVFKNRYGQICTFEFNHDFICEKTEVSECRYAATQIETINEIPRHILIKLKSGGSCIIPKDKMAQPELLRENLKELAAFLHIDYNMQLDWKWQ